jgi:hypothetical protein
LRKKKEVAITDACRRYFDKGLTTGSYYALG